MYKVLLVDDERIILDGISQMVDWPAYQTILAGTAQNGIQAYEKIMREAPDIVVCDIRMPGLDGLELVAKTYASHPHIKFVLLSGFGEFEYANRAMQYGVKHYLLKPTDEIKIGEALKEVIGELTALQHKESFIQEMKGRLRKVLPHVKEQVLKEFVTNKTYGRHDLEEYRSLFQYSFDQPVRLLLFQLEGNVEFEHQFAVKNIAEDLLDSTLLSTTIGQQVLVLIENRDDEQLHQQLQDIRCTFKQYYKMDVTIAISDPGPVTLARKLYRDTLQCLNYRFYLDESGMITTEDTLHSGSLEGGFVLDEERLCMPVRSGHRKEAELALAEFVQELKRAQLSIELTKSYVIQQYVSLIRLTDPEQMQQRYARIPEIAEMSTLHAIQAFLEDTVREITQRNFEQNKVKYNAIVRKVVEIIEQQLGNSELTLNLVANDMLYMNADYLGKLFKKETGEKFSNYVMKLRMKRAIEMMQSDPDIKIFEMAELLGFGDNPQYFSQVFKKQIGCTPSEFMKK
ncbi:MULTISPECIES: response regulator [Paenibacillus]|jgi:two-component system response regulator YesN|nr:MULTISPECIES: response regulator [Paenibacillus]ANA78479.1 DNA-binding response regulator [Paenibacillus glucanolyticus]ETT34375.1 two component AraC family transcriptional regulator [Paenibacillus sp. FSL R5-808]MDH6669664.1 two-component system response regulator YesN [Paenibacillus sp. LBL]OMF83091.1 DNA-binding response regulator [Paenibacillus glucanolyticus]